MAWTFGAIGTPAFDLDGSNGITVPAVTGGSDGDPLLMYVAQRPNAVTGSWTTPSGWTLLATDDISGSDQAALYGKLKSGAQGDVAVTSSATNSCGGVMFRYTGGSLTVHASADATDIAQEDIDTAALTISQDNTLVLILGRFAWNHDATVSSWPGTATQRLAAVSALGSEELSLFVGEIIQTTAANLSAGSINRSDTNTANGGSLVISLQVASTGGKVPPLSLM